MRYASVMSNLSGALALFFLSACQSTANISPISNAEYLIENGIVYDGTGGPYRTADVAIRGDKIVFVGDAAGDQFPEARKIDASGLVVAPGFIDPHTHAGSDLGSEDANRRANLAFAFQGVTTVIVGNDGHGSTKVAAMASAASKQQIGTNVGYMAGFGHIRKTVIGDADRPSTAGEQTRMEKMLESAMCQGARGLSAGLYYTPQNFATTEEVVALAKVSAEYGGYYDTHMRDESTYNIGVTGAVSEALEIGQKSGSAVHISHIKALGPAVWGHSAKMIALIEEARAQGQNVTADQYPWSASGTRISNALAPRWSLDGGLVGLRNRLADPGLRGRIKKEMRANLKRRGGAEKLLITGGLGEAGITVGQTLSEFAQGRDLSPLEAAIEILQSGDARVASFNMNPKDINAFAVQDWVVTGSDGSTGHPRKYASFPKAYQDFVKQDKLMSLAQYVRRSSGKTADIIGLKDRGYLRRGMIADIVLFDPEKFEPAATYQNPRALSTGVRDLFVNGIPVITNGEYTGELPGRPLLKENQC